MDGDLLGLSPSIVPDTTFTPSFQNNFWGVKHNGYEVLHNSLKNAPASTKEICEFLREVALVEEHFAKNLTRLGKQEKSNVPHILISPIWRILKSCVEKTGAAHLELATKLSDLSRDIKRYADEDLKDRHRPHKKQFHLTADSTDKIQHASVNVAKSREHRARLESSTSTGQKHENRLKKANDDMKKHVDNFNSALDVFETSFDETAQTLYELETKHISKMSSFLRSVQKAQESCNVMDRQINSAFEQAIETEGDPECVLRQFADSRGTGSDRPKRETIEDFVGERTDKRISHSPNRHNNLSTPATRTGSKSPKVSERKHDDDTSSHDKSNSSAASISSEVLPRHDPIGEKKATSASKLTSIFRAAPKIPNSESSSKAIQDPESISESDDEHKLRINSEKSDTGSMNSKDSPEVDSDGYTIRKPVARKTSSTSDSSWDSDDNDGKVDTYKIKVEIKPVDEIDPSSLENQELVKLSGPLHAAPPRKALRPGRSPRTVQPSPLTIPLTIPAIPLTLPPTPAKIPPTPPKIPPTPPKIPPSPLTISPIPPSEMPSPIRAKTPAIEQNENLDKSISEKSRVATPSSDHAKSPVPSIPLSRPITPLKTGGSLINENINWGNVTTSSSKFGAPIASVESLSPTSSSGSPYFGVDLPVRVAITETINVKFIGVGDENTKIVTNAEIYLDFATTTTRYLNDNHSLDFHISGPVDNIKVNPAFARLLDDGRIELETESIRSYLTKMSGEKPQESHHMFKVASYRVKSTVNDLPLLLASYWKKEDDNYRIRVVAKPSTRIQNLKLLSKANFSECNADPPHTNENGLLTFNFKELKPGKDKIISAYLSDCSNPSAFAAQFSMEGFSRSEVSLPPSSSFKIMYQRKRIKTGVFVSEPIL